MQALSDYLSISSEDCFLCLNALYYKYQYLCHMAKYTVFHPCHHPGGDGIFVFCQHWQQSERDIPIPAHFFIYGPSGHKEGGRGASLFSFLERGVNDLETEPNAVKGKKQSDKTIFVVVEDGRIQEVYACASLAGVEVEILDKDDAKVSEDAAWRSTLQRIAEVAEQYTQIY